MSETSKKNPAITQEQIIEYFKNLNLVELNQVIEAIKSDFGIEETIPQPVSTDKTPNQEENKNVSLILKKLGTQSLQTYRTIGAKLGKTLLEAKKVVETLPVTILDSVPKEEAQELKTQLEAQGAEVEVK